MVTQNYPRNVTNHCHISHHNNQGNIQEVSHLTNLSHQTNIYITSTTVKCSVPINYFQGDKLPTLGHVTAIIDTIQNLNSHLHNSTAEELLKLQESQYSSIKTYTTE